MSRNDYIDDIAYEDDFRSSVPSHQGGGATYSPGGNVDNARFSVGASRYDGNDIDEDPFGGGGGGWSGAQGRQQQPAASAPVLGPVGAYRPPPSTQPQPSYRHVDVGRQQQRRGDYEEDGDPVDADARRHSMIVGPEQVTVYQPQGQSMQQQQQQYYRPQQPPPHSYQPGGPTMAAVPSSDSDGHSSSSNNSGSNDRGGKKKGGKKPRKPLPKLGLFILAGCCAGFAYSLYITPGIIAPMAVNPLIGPTSDSLVASGAKVTCLITGPKQAWWRLVSPMWLHAGAIHLVTNMNMLAQLGFDLERQAGSEWQAGRQAGSRAQQPDKLRR